MNDKPKKLTKLSSLKNRKKYSKVAQNEDSDSNSEEIFETDPNGKFFLKK